MKDKKRLHFTCQLTDAEKLDADGNKVQWNADFVIDDGAPLAFCYSAAGEFFDKMISFINEHAKQTQKASEVEPQEVVEDCCEAKEE